MPIKDKLKGFKALFRGKSSHEKKLDVERSGRDYHLIRIAGDDSCHDENGKKIQLYLDKQQGLLIRSGGKLYQLGQAVDFKVTGADGKIYAVAYRRQENFQQYGVSGTHGVAWYVADQAGGTREERVYQQGNVFRSQVVPTTNTGLSQVYSPLPISQVVNVANLQGYDLDDAQALPEDQKSAALNKGSALNKGYRKLVGETKQLLTTPTHFVQAREFIQKANAAFEQWQEKRQSADVLQNYQSQAKKAEHMAARVQSRIALIGQKIPVLESMIAMVPTYAPTTGEGIGYPKLLTLHTHLAKLKSEAQQLRGFLNDIAVYQNNLTISLQALSRLESGSNTLVQLPHEQVNEENVNNNTRSVIQEQTNKRSGPVFFGNQITLQGSTYDTNKAALDPTGSGYLTVQPRNYEVVKQWVLQAYQEHCQSNQALPLISDVTLESPSLAFDQMQYVPKDQQANLEKSMTFCPGDGGEICIHGAGVKVEILAVAPEPKKATTLTQDQFKTAKQAAKEHRILQMWKTVECLQDKERSVIRGGDKEVARLLWAVATVRLNKCPAVATTCAFQPALTPEGKPKGKDAAYCNEVKETMRKMGLLGPIDATLREKEVETEQGEKEKVDIIEQAFPTFRMS